MSNIEGGKSPLLEKVIRWIIPAGLAAIGFYYWGLILPFLIKTLANTWLFAAMVIATLGVGGFLLSNKNFLYLTYLGLCRKVTTWFIKLDPLTTMDGYIAVLKKKRAILKESLIQVGARKVKLERLVDVKTKSKRENEKFWLAAKKQGDERSAQLYATKALADKGSLDIYAPILARYNRNYELMEELEENWSANTEKLEYQVATKREELENMKDLFKGLRSCEDFISSDSPEAQAYGIAIQALEQEVSSKIAYMNDFEKKARPIMNSIKVQKQANEDEAMQLLEDLVKQDSIKLPDYQNFSVTGGMIKVAETIPSQAVSKYKL